MISWILIGAICTLYLYLYVKMNPGDMPVFPGKIPILGNVSLLMGDDIASWKFIKKLTEFTMKNGHVSVVYVGMMPIYVITDPDDCYKVLSTSLERPMFANKYLKRFLGNGLLTGPVSVWRDHRKIMNSTFNQRILDGFLDIFNSQSRYIAENWREYVDKGPFDHHDYLEKTTFKTICMTAAGADMGHQKHFNEECLQSFRAIVTGAMERAKNPLFYFDMIYNISALKKTEDSHIQVTHELTGRVLKQKSEEVHSSDDDYNTSLGSFKSFLQHMLGTRGAKMSKDDIKDEINNLIFAGSQSTPAMIAYTLLLLGTYSDVQEKCYQELHEVFGDSDRDVTKSDLPQLKYLDAVIKETLRICPVAPFTGRTITEDIPLKNTTLRKGHMCAVALYGYLNDPDIWGSDVHEFIPERWLEPGWLPKNPNALGAFGYGRRGCIGKAYAMMTMKVSLYHILRRYRVVGNYHNMVLRNLVINKPAGGHEISIALR